MSTVSDVDQSVVSDLLEALPGLGRRPAPEDSVFWRSLLNGEDLRFQRMQRRHLRLPAEPRCSLCCAPFRSWGGLVARAVSRGPASPALSICSKCQHLVEANPGSATTDATLIVANLRESASTGTDARSFGAFIEDAAAAISRHDGIYDGLDGAELRAVFIPWRAGGAHAGKATMAARDLFGAAIAHGLERHGVQLAVGIHSGGVRVGTLSAGGGRAFGFGGAALTTASLLASAATAGEALVSTTAWDQQGGPVAQSRRRSVPLPGALQPVEAVVVRGDIEAAL